MRLSKETVVTVTAEQSNIIGHMNYAAFKLWNILNYERRYYKDQGMSSFPDWYYQKKAHKDNMWYKMLPSQSAQEVCKLLDKSWKSYFKLLETGGIENPSPPGFKCDGIPVTYMQNGIKHEPGDENIRLSIPKKLKSFMADNYDIHENYLNLENVIFRDMDRIKQIKLYKPQGKKMRVIVVYEVADVDILADNGHYLSIDLGLKNLFTCYDNVDRSFILGRKYLNILHYYDKQISHYQSICALQQSAQGIKYPKPSKRVFSLYKKKKNSTKDYLHKCTRSIADYCRDNGINVVIIGDITGIRKNFDKGSVLNQQFHSLPFSQIYTMLDYKLKLYGITLVKQNEAYSSQVSPTAGIVSKETACKNNRIKRGLYMQDNLVFNADAVGAYNIMRLYTGNSYNFKSLINPQKAAV